MKVAIHQPQFLPYPGFFHKLSKVDTWVVMDDAQYDKRFTNRNRILAPSGPIWLSVPIDKTLKFGSNKDMKVNNSVPWREEHWKKLSYSYKNTKGFPSFGPYFEDLYKREHTMLLAFDLETAKRIIQWLGIRVEIVLESELRVNEQGTRRLVEVCRAVGADTYVSGSGGRNYMDEPLFASNKIKLEYQSYTPVPYKQRFGDSFVPNLSVVDLLFNAGPESRRHVVDSEVTMVRESPQTPVS